MTDAIRRVILTRRSFTGRCDISDSIRHIHFNDHVPEGREVCENCCGGRLAVRPGYFRDRDVDVTNNGSGLCCFCAGTGVNIGLSKHEVNLLMAWRFQMTNFDDGQLACDEFYQMGTAILREQQTEWAFHAVRETLTGILQGLARASLAFQPSLVRGVKGLWWHELWQALSAHAKWRAIGRPDGVHAKGIVLGAAAKLAPMFQPVAERRISDEELAGFTPDEVPERLQGLTPRLLAELHNTLWHFGHRHEMEPTATLTHEFRRPSVIEETGDDAAPIRVTNRGSCKMSVSVHATDENNHTMMIFGPDNTIAGPGVEMLTIPGGPRGSDNGMVMWDGRVSLEDVKQFVRLINEGQASVGLIDPETGKRTSSFRTSAEPPMKVDELFANPGVAMPVLDGTPEETLAKFDRPEELMVIDHGSGPAIIHKRDYEYMVQRDRMAEEVLREKGLTKDSVSDLSTDDVMALRAEIERRMHLRYSN